MRGKPTLIAAMLLRRPRRRDALRHPRQPTPTIMPMLGRDRMREGGHDGRDADVILPERQLFICDTHVNATRRRAGWLRSRCGRRGGAAASAEADRRAAVALELRQLDAPSAQKMRDALAIIMRARAGPRGRGRDARRLRAVEDASATPSSRIRACTATPTC
jgi:hypothetical protein